MQGIAGLMSMPSGPGIGPMMSIISGSQQQQAYDAQASALGQESTYALQSSLLQAAQNDYQTTKTIGTQDAQFGASGVTLAGSPLGILTETQQLGNQVSNQIRLQGQLQSGLLGDEGLQMLRQGSTVWFSGQANAANDQYQYELQKAQGVDSALAGGAGGLYGAAAGLAGLGGFSGLGSPLSGLSGLLGGNYTGVPSTLNPLSTINPPQGSGF